MGNNIFGNCEKSKHNLFIRLTILCLLIFSFSPRHFAQEVAPLELGNVWVYEEGDSRTRHSIIDTNYVINSIKYYTQQYGSGNTLYLEYLRLNNEGYYAIYEDTSYPAPNHEKNYYKKNAVIGDTWENPTEYFPMVYTLIDTVRQNIFGQVVTVKYLEIDASVIFFKEWWTEEFGVLARQQHPFPWYVYALTGCIIDGVVYGDTSLVLDVNDDIEPIKDFILEQNFPNPFNPTTTIRYNIPSAGVVQILVLS
jgi:hypothetical protein